MHALPVFIGGFRSGTTLLANLLGMHPAVAAWFETKEFCEALRWQRVLQMPDQAGFEAPFCRPQEPAGFSPDAVMARMRTQMQDTHARIAGERDSGKAAHERYPLGNDCVAYSTEEAFAALARWRASLGDTPQLDALRAANATLITSLGARQLELRCASGDSVVTDANAATLWINKTPEISRFARELRAALGPCRVIYLVRDGRAVVASGKGLKWGDVATLAWHWKGLLEWTRAAMSDQSAYYLELRYEELVLNPKRELDRVLAFCNLESRGSEIVERFMAGFGDRAFDLSRLRAAALDAADTQTFTRIAGDLQQALGYPL